jgi:multiple sugar transport system permease protein
MATRTAETTLEAARVTTARGKFNWTPYLFILPHLIFFIAFVVWPFVNGIWISLHQYDYLRPEQTKFLGLQNYIDLFAPGTLTFNEFWDSLKNTGIFVLVSVPPLVVVPLLLAVLLNTKIPGRNIFRAVYFAPWVLSVSVVGLLWWWIFQSSGGLLNYYWSPAVVPVLTVVYFLMKFVVPPILLILLGLAGVNTIRAQKFDLSRARLLQLLWWLLAVAVTIWIWLWFLQAADPGGSAPRWLSSMPWAWVSITIATVWWTLGFNMIILLAALQDIPDQLYEAASLDGASRWQTFTQITLPMLQPVLLFVVTITIIASFNLFGQPFIMTGGGPAQPNGSGATTPVMYRIYIQGFTRPLQGSAAAMSFVVAAIMILISYLNFRLFSNKEKS